MSHARQDTSKAEPNLTSLLDVVLQLIMFFLMCANFVSTQVNENIKLPVMQSARPADKKETDLLFLNMRPDGTLEVVGKDPMKEPARIKTFLRNQFDDTKRALLKEKENQVNTVVVIRADENAEYKKVYELLRWCKDVGYRRFQVRAKSRSDS
jgi:biopolymer transport protein ExbD